MEKCTTRELLEYLDDEGLFFDAINLITVSPDFESWDVEISVDEKNKKATYKDPISGAKVEEDTINLGLTRKMVKKFSKSGTGRLHISAMDIEGELKVLSRKSYDEENEYGSFNDQDIALYIEHKQIDTKEELLEHLRRAFAISNEKSDHKSEYSLLRDEMRANIENLKKERGKPKKRTKYADENEEMSVEDLIEFTYEDGYDFDLYQSLFENKRGYVYYDIEVDIDKKKKELILYLPDKSKKHISVAELGFSEKDLIGKDETSYLILRVLVIGDREDGNIKMWLIDMNEDDEGDTLLQENFKSILEYLHINTKAKLLDFLDECRAYRTEQNGGVETKSFMESMEELAIAFGDMFL